MVTWFLQKLINGKWTSFSWSFLFSFPFAPQPLTFTTWASASGIMSAWEEKSSSSIIFWTYSLQTMDLFWQGSWYKKIIESLKMFNILRLEQFHPVRLVNWFAFCLFAFFVPFVYIRIFYWRWNNKPVGISELDRIFRKKRNFVSMWFNMSIWFFELIGVVIMVSNYLDKLINYFCSLNSYNVSP